MAAASIAWYCTAPAAGARPNILVILADDLGYSDLGCYGGEIRTPNLDALAANGLQYTQFYNTARCWPTRAAMLTGHYAQQVDFDRVPHGSGGGHGPRPKWATLLPALLKPLGYRSYHSGKWHLDGGQIEAGFDRAYSFDDHDRYFAPRAHSLDDMPLPPVHRSDDYYATTEIADRAIGFLKEHLNDYAEQPFFSYVAFTAPHFPLQAPQCDIDQYRNEYSAGWDTVRNDRWARMQLLLNIPGKLAPLEPNIGPPYDFPRDIAALGHGEVTHEVAWESLSPEQRQFQSAKMEVHAAMVDRLDQEVGRIVDFLQENRALDDTVIFFLSDNGASAEIMIRGNGHDPLATAGSADSYLCLGPGWSSAANTPFRRHKTWVHEGGIASPLIVHWPAGIDSATSLRTQAVGHVVDLAPTIVQLAGGEFADLRESQGAPRPPGVPLQASWDDDRPLPRTDLWWYHEGNRAFRRGAWKIVAARGEAWALYDLSRDRAENNDLSEDHAEVVRKLEEAWTEQLRALTAKDDVVHTGL